MRWDYRFGAGIALCALLFLPGLSIRAQIAPGELQSAGHTATVTGMVMQGDGSALAGADVRLSGPAFLSTKSDAHGTFSFTSVPYGAYRITVTSGFGATSRDNIVVNGDINVVIRYVAQNSNGMKEIAHVSTGSAGARLNVTPASIASIAPSEYAFQGNTTWTQLLNRIPGVTVSGDLEAGQQVDSAIVGNLDAPQVISINGALPYETSVTLDGMPLQSQSKVAAPGAGFNLSALPLSIFDTADIVRGPGANAPSIANSIGGSLVLHAPEFIGENQVEFSISNDPWGGIVSNMKVAHRFGRLSVLVTYGVNDSPGAFGAINTMSAAPQSLTQGTINGNTFIGCIAGTFSSCSSTLVCNTISGTGTTTYGGFNGCGIKDRLLYCCVPYSTAWSQHNGAAALSYQITPTVTAEVFYAGTTGTSETPSAVHLDDFAPGAGYSGALAPGLTNLIGVFPDTDNSTTSLLEEKLAAFLGRGVLRVAALQNYSESSSGNIPPPNGQYTLYGVGYYLSAPTTPQVFNGTSASVVFPQENFHVQQWTRNRDLFGSYAIQLGEKSSASISYTKSYYNSANYAPFSGTATGGLVLICDNQQSGSSTTLNEVRLNANTRLSDTLSLDGSWYFANASFHTQTSFYPYLQMAPDPQGVWHDQSFPYNAPRLGITWRPNQNVVLRGAIGGGYALPALGQLIGAPLQCGGPTCISTPPNPNLAPETSFGFDAGTDIRLHHETTLSFDLYRVNLYGQFFSETTTSAYSGPGCGSPPCNLYSTQYNNLQQSRYEGINASIQHEPEHGMYMQASLGLIRAYIVSLPPGFYTNPSCLSINPTGCNTYLIPGANFNGANEAGIAPTPYANGSATIGYRWTPQKYIDLAPTYYGNGNSYFEPAFVEFDAHASYPLGEHVTLFATFRNITNIYGQSYQTLGIPTLAAPAVPPNNPCQLWGIPYGPRTVIVTANFKE